MMLGFLFCLLRNAAIRKRHLKETRRMLLYCLNAHERVKQAAYNAGFEQGRAPFKRMHGERGRFTGSA